MDQVFGAVARRTELVESLQRAVNSKNTNMRVGLHRDRPDAVRQRGDEKF